MKIAFGLISAALALTPKQKLPAAPRTSWMMVELSGGGRACSHQAMATKDACSIAGRRVKLVFNLKASAAQIRVIARARLNETPPTRVPRPWRTREMETCASAAGRRSPAAGSGRTTLAAATSQFPGDLGSRSPLPAPQHGRWRGRSAGDMGIVIKTSRKARRRAKSNPRPTTAEDIAANSRRKAGEALGSRGFSFVIVGRWADHARTSSARANAGRRFCEEADHLGRSRPTGRRCSALSRPRRSLRTRSRRQPLPRS